MGITAQDASSLTSCRSSFTGSRGRHGAGLGDFNGPRALADIRFPTSYGDNAVKRNPRHPGSLTLRPAIALVSLCAGGVLLTPTAASADGTYRWQGERSRNYLEIRKSSTANQARVIVWPDQGSYNQWWSDFKQVSDGYYRLVNYNSQKSLDRYDGHNGGFCWGYQYDWTG